MTWGQQGGVSRIRKKQRWKRLLGKAGVYGEK